MKKSLLLFGILASLILLAITACSSDEDAIYDQELDCKYTWQNLDPQYDYLVSNTTDDKTITSYGDVITRVEFNTSVSLSPEQVFADYLPISEDNCMMFVNSLKNNDTNYASYLQCYKGVQVWYCGCECYFDQNDQLEKIEGKVVPVNNLDVHPTISESKAMEILINALHSDYDINYVSLGLFVVPFFADGKIDVHLAYLHEQYEGCFGIYRTFIDAHSGEILSCDLR